jgi:hypothetical protein
MSWSHKAIQQVQGGASGGRGQRGVQPYSITKLLQYVVFVFKLVSTAAEMKYNTAGVLYYCTVVKAVNWHTNGATGT